MPAGITFHNIMNPVEVCLCEPVRMCVYMGMCLGVCDHLEDENFGLVNIPSWCSQN